MSRMKYNYDETGNAFIYFLLIIHGFVLAIFSSYYYKTFKKSILVLRVMHFSLTNADM